MSPSSAFIAIGHRMGGGGDASVNVRDWRGPLARIAS
ncbi:hypothetical protein GC56T2_0465 [Geobacillus sp. C56-T2]|nr:hypothetical protein GC56T2_0465 [Geobacillus sp. C56-T2]